MLKISAAYPFSLLLLTLLVSLPASAIATGERPEENFAGSIDLDQASSYFSEFQNLCESDGGELWGISLCAPILFVDPVTRDIVTNRADEGGALEARGALFVGKLPSDVTIANTAMEWRGVRWTMLNTYSLSRSRTARLRLLAHEAFHNIQPGLNLDPGAMEMNRHLDTVHGRYWLQLEWRALRQALALPAEERSEPVGDALLFRAARRALFPEAQTREIPLEVFEGVAEYTGCHLAGYNNREAVEFSEGKEEGLDSFVRSFAYVSGPLYGYLLDGAGVEWRASLKPDTDLARILGRAMNLSPAGEPAAGAASAARKYDGEVLLAAEERRHAERAETIADWRRKLVEGPVLILDLETVSSGSFNPNAILPLSETETVYATRGLVADWGTLEVENGILENAESGLAHISLAGGLPDGNPVRADGWTLELGEGWEIVPAERPGDFRVLEAVR